MIRSMTGFAQGQGEEDSWAVSVTLRALNHRFLDVHLRLPSDLEPHEIHLRERIRGRVQRGHVDATFQVESRERRPLQVDKEFLRSYLETFNELKREHGLGSEPDLTAILRQPGVLRAGSRQLTKEESQRLAAVADRVLADALDRLEEMRRREGAALERELRERVQDVVRNQRQLAQLAERTLPAYHRWLTNRLQTLLDQTPLDPARLAQEAAYLADRSDVSEELTRLASHAEHFETLLESDGRVGKRLDFLLQEMNRETNTVLSKSSGLEADGLQMTRVALDIKAQIERLREQVQNVE